MADVSVENNARNNQSGAFARFGTAVGLANLGDGIAVVAWAWIASLLTRDPLWIAILPAALRVPWVLFALPSGILADRMDRKRLIVFCDLIRTLAYGMAGGAMMLSLPLAEPVIDGIGRSTLYWSLLSLGFLIGCAEVARDNAAQSMLPKIVPSEKLERANGLLGSIETVGNSMAGPALGAFIVAIFVPLPFLAIAIALLFAALLTASLKGDFKPSEKKTQDWRDELMEGFRFVVSHPMLRVLVLITGFWNFFAEMSVIALVLHVQENMNAGATTYGLILAVGAFGGVVGGVSVAPLMKLFPTGVLAKWMNLASAPMFLLIAFAPGPITVSVAMFFFYLSGIVWNTLSISYRQRVVSDEIRGRVNSVYRLFAWGMMPLGLVVSGAIVSIAEGPLARETALKMPFLTAATGIFILAAASWRPLGQGFK
ncbi:MULTISPECIES: MFS transporter [unclassified Sulfitobacter]|uniref:MFS transporter n=1 Tax=unclassified Sulfitobacter TaxID=196795 RepID=UPI0007C3C428|nr:MULTISPECIES: MFS transporter [unclassified Sulfitobacter]KZY05150.1 MFS transporter [Sulfitobacter sp. HI0023]KZY22790.1 MFS transporter [Sulfitobacter sp. HI0040]KZZ71408.1 MFS transporter [Sulfitobacter sp. HI0129]